MGRDFPSVQIFCELQFIGVDQTACEENPLLIFRHFRQIEGKYGRLAIRRDDRGVNVRPPVFDRLADAFEVDVLIDGKINIIIGVGKGQYPPVDTVGAIALGCVLNADVGKTAERGGGLEQHNLVPALRGGEGGFAPGGSAADDNDFFSGQVDDLVFSDTPQELYRGENAVRVLTRKSELPVPKNGIAYTITICTDSILLSIAEGSDFS